MISCVHSTAVRVFVWVISLAWYHLPFGTAFTPVHFSWKRALQSHRPTVAFSLPSDDIGVGIDLGTTNSAIAYLDGNTPTIIEIPNNGRTMKSVVAYDEQDNPLVGTEALEWEAKTKISAYRHVKRVIGTGSTFLKKEIIEVVPHLIPTGNFAEKIFKKGKEISLGKMLQDAEENPTMLKSLRRNSDGKFDKVSPVTVSAAILERLLEVARSHTKKSITRAVIGVPAYFNDAQKNATIQAAEKAGIEKVKLLTEPEAAALAYGLDKGSKTEELVLVFDLGGGTYDVSILLVSKGFTEIVCTSGNAQLGGSNFDAKIAAELATHSPACRQSEACRDKMIQFAESIRITLSNSRSVSVFVPLTEEGWRNLKDPQSLIVHKAGDSYPEGTSRTTHKLVEWTRHDIEKLCQDEIDQLLRPLREAAIMAGAMLPGDARPTLVESVLESNGESFYDDDEELLFSQRDTGPNEDLDYGAIKKSQKKGRKRSRKLSKDEQKFWAESRKAIQNSPLEAGAKVISDGISGYPIDRVVLVGGATRMPAIGRFLAALTGITPQKTVDPDEAVALGCAVHVGILDGREEFGNVLNPFQAAMLRAIVKKQERDKKRESAQFNVQDDEEEDDGEEQDFEDSEEGEFEESELDDYEEFDLEDFDLQNL